MTRDLIAWIEIPTTNFENTVEFYQKLLSVELKTHDYGSEKMAFLPEDSGAISQAPGFVPSENGVLVSFNAGAKLDEMLNMITENGGSIVQPKTKIEAENRGYFALFKDPEGNRLGLYGQ